MTFSFHHGIHVSVRALALQSLSSICYQGSYSNARNYPRLFVTGKPEIRRGTSAFNKPGLFRCSPGAVGYWRRSPHLKHVILLH